MKLLVCSLIFKIQERKYLSLGISRQLADLKIIFNPRRCPLIQKDFIPPFTIYDMESQNGQQNTATQVSVPEMTMEFRSPRLSLISSS